MTVDEAGTKHLVSSLRGIITNSKGELTVCFVNSTGKAEVILILIQAWNVQAVSLLLREVTLLWWSSLPNSFQLTISLDICGFCHRIPEGRYQVMLTPKSAHCRKRNREIKQVHIFTLLRLQQFVYMYKSFESLACYLPVFVKTGRQNQQGKVWPIP